MSNRGGRQRRYDVAIVVVHGIGSQARASTLLTWAEPLLGWCDEWSRRRGGTGVAVIESRLLPADVAGDGGSFVAAEVGIPAAADGASRWCLSEARWADVFTPPLPGELLGWSWRFLVRAARRLWLHLGRVIRTKRHRGRALRRARKGLRVGGAWEACHFALGSMLVVLALPGFVLAAGMGLLLGLVAIGLLRALSRVPWAGPKVARVTDALVMSIGDASAWTTRPVRAGAMRTVVSDQLRRARVDADSVVVVAHSQGAAVALEAVLADEDPDGQVKLLVTVGAGTSLLGRPIWSPGGGDDGTAGPVARWGARRPPLRWINVWTMWDPVPAGPVGDGPTDTNARWDWLAWRQHAEPTWKPGRARSAAQIPTGLRRAAEAPGPEEWLVSNQASIFRDHTTYSRNVPQVIAGIAQAIMETAAPAGDRPDAAQDEPDASIRRAWNWQARLVGLLGGTRILALIAATAATFMLAPSLPGWELAERASGNLPGGAGGWFAALARVTPRSVQEAIVVVGAFALIALLFGALVTAAHGPLSRRAARQLVRPLEGPDPVRRRLRELVGWSGVPLGVVLVGLFGLVWGGLSMGLWPWEQHSGVTTGVFALGWSMVVFGAPAYQRLSEQRPRHPTGSS